MKKVIKLSFIFAYLFLTAFLAIAKEATDENGGPGPGEPHISGSKGPWPYGGPKGPGPFGPGGPGPYKPGPRRPSGGPGPYGCGPWGSGPYGPGPGGPGTYRCGPWGPYPYGPEPYGPGFGYPGYGGWPCFGGYPGYGGWPWFGGYPGFGRSENPTGTENKMSDEPDLEGMFKEKFKKDVMAGYERP